MLGASGEREWVAMPRIEWGQVPCAESPQMGGRRVGRGANMGNCSRDMGIGTVISVEWLISWVEWGISGVEWICALG